MVAFGGVSASLRAGLIVLILVVLCREAKAQS
jgi:hypothetical protein